jgi:hypothetical protein
VLFLSTNTNSVSRGGTIQVSGRLDPPEEGRRIVISVINSDFSEGVPTYEVDTDESGAYSVEIPIPHNAPPGMWTIIAYAPDQAGYDDIRSDPVEVMVTNESPTIPTLLGPANGTTTSERPTFTLSSTDPELDQVKFRIELSSGGPNPVVIETDLTQSGSQLEVLSTARLSPGNWRWRAKAIDSFGAESEWSNWSEFVVSDSIPTRLIGMGTFALNLQTSRLSIPDLFSGGTVRFKKWNPNNQGYEDVSTLSPAEAYWFNATTEAMARLDGTPVSPDTPIRLVPGWNLVPVYADLRWDPQAIRVRRSGQIKTLAEASSEGWIEDYAWAWEQDGGNPHNGRYRLVYDSTVVPGAVNSLEPWRGYWIYAHVNCEIILSSGSRAVSRSRGTPYGSWGLRIVATTSSGSSEVLLGMSNSRALSVGLPPDPPSSTVPVRISIKQGEVRLGADIRRRTQQYPSWDVEVEVASSEIGREVTLHWPNIAMLPRTANLMLVDLQTGKRCFLRTTPSYTFKSAADGGRYRFRVETVPISKLLRITNTRVLHGRGSPYTFVFGLTSSAEVKVKIQAADGRILRTVVNQVSRNAGMHSVTWDGRDEQGIALPPGQYIVSIEATTGDGQFARATTTVVITR